MGRLAVRKRGEAAPTGALSRHHRLPLSEVRRTLATPGMQEISDALKLKLPLDGGDSRSAVDRPRTLVEVKSVAEFLARMDELVWRRSEHGANRRVFDPENISAVEERVRLWEKIARGYCS